MDDYGNKHNTAHTQNITHVENLPRNLSPNLPPRLQHSICRGNGNKNQFSSIVDRSFHII
jgi:hypothetical protein